MSIVIAPRKLLDSVDAHRSPPTTFRLNERFQPIRTNKSQQRHRQQSSDPKYCKMKKKNEKKNK